MAVYKESSSRSTYIADLERALENLFSGFGIDVNKAKSYPLYDKAFDALADIIFDLSYDRENRKWVREFESKKRKSVKESCDKLSASELKDLIKKYGKEFDVSEKEATKRINLLSKTDQCNLYKTLLIMLGETRKEED